MDVLHFGQVPVVVNSHLVIARGKFDRLAAIADCLTVDENVSLLRFNIIFNFPVSCDDCANAENAHKQLMAEIKTPNTTSFLRIWWNLLYGDDRGLVRIICLWDFVDGTRKMLTPSPRFGAPPMTLVSHPSRETRPLLTHIVMRYIVYLLPCTLYRGAIYMHVAAATICPHDPSISGELGVAGQAGGREEIHARSGLGVDRAGMSRPLKRVCAESERSPQHGTSGVLMFRVFRFDPRVTRFGACGIDATLSSANHIVLRYI